MAGTVSAYVYTSDNGTDYALRMGDAGAAAQGSVGATTEPALPKSIKPRHLYVEYTTYRRKVPITDPTDTQWTGASATWSAKVFPTDASPVSWAIRGRIGERRFSV